MISSKELLIERYVLKSESLISVLNPSWRSETNKMEIKFLDEVGSITDTISCDVSVVDVKLSKLSWKTEEPVCVTYHLAITSVMYVNGEPVRGY